MIDRDWGSVVVATRLEKTVENQFVEAWSHMITKGLRPGDGFMIAKDLTAHKAANELVRAFLKTDMDAICFIDSDWDGGPQFVEELRTVEDGWKYDIFSAFYTRRGWPPEAIWFKRTTLGDLMQCLVWKDNYTEDTAMAGLHSVLIRREVFEKLRDERPEIPADEFDWFWYPRHEAISEDGAFSQEAIDNGFRIGSTTVVKAGHISRIVTGWSTYQEYLNISGTVDTWKRYYSLVEQVADFTAEAYDDVIAKSIQGWHWTKEAWKKYQPEEADEVRAFYGHSDNGYLYDLLAWNASPVYERLVEPLESISGERVLVVGAGLGGEVEPLRSKNQVDVFELPGVLRDFLAHRFYGNNSVYVCPEETVTQLSGSYDLIVAIDVLEHFHPDEFGPTLDHLLSLLTPEGRFYLHNNFDNSNDAPQHFIHTAEFDAWCETNGITQPEDSYGFYERRYEAIPA